MIPPMRFLQATGKPAFPARSSRRGTRQQRVAVTGKPAHPGPEFSAVIPPSGKAGTLGRWGLPGCPKVAGSMLQRPFFTPVVVAFWCVTTGWLAIAKILPAWQPGAPPGHQALYATGSRLMPVAWTVTCGDEPVGWALTRPTRIGKEGIQVDSRLHFDRLPLNELLPSWATLLVRQLSDDPFAAFDARGRLIIDSRGALESFSSVVDLPGTDQPLVLNGTVHDGTVSIRVAAGDMRYDVTRHLPADVMIGDELSPQATLPNLTEGRRWTVPIYSPVRTGRSPLEILHAEVGPEETFYWDDQLVPAHVVSYREDPTSDRPPRWRLWVDRSGRVLRQEAALIGARVAFVRRPDDDAVRLAQAQAQAEAEVDRDTPAVSEAARFGSP
jgi:hypothetical protein